MPRGYDPNHVIGGATSEFSMWRPSGLLQLSTLIKQRATRIRSPFVYGTKRRNQGSWREGDHWTLRATNQKAVGEFLGGVIEPLPYSCHTDITTQSAKVMVAGSSWWGLIYIHMFLILKFAEVSYTGNANGRVLIVEKIAHVRRINVQ